MSGYVYVIGTELADRVKIGFTSGDPRARLKALQTGCPDELVVIATEVGSQSLERNLHERFAEKRVRGEWFRVDKELREYIIDANVRHFEREALCGRIPPKWTRIF
jgi:hypothetical protein